MYTVGIVTFKCVKGLAPSYLSDCFVTGSIVHDRNTRDKDYLNIPAYQSAAGQQTFLYRGIKHLKRIATYDHCCRQPAYFQKET